MIIIKHTRHMTSWEHDAQKHGRQLLHAASTRTDVGLPVISPEDTTNCKVLEVAGDGHCALHSICRLLNPERDSVFGALASEITQTREDIALEMIAAVFSKDYEQLVENTVSDEEMLRLGKLGYERGFYPKRTPSAGRAARAVRHKPLKTVREVVAGIEDQLEHDYLAVGDTTDCFDGDLYRDEFLHLMYNVFGGYNATTYAAGTATVRNPSSSNVAETKFNHFSAIVIPQESVPWAKPYMLQRGSSGRSVFGHEKPPNNFCPCPTTSDKRPMNIRALLCRSTWMTRPRQAAADVPERKTTPPGKAVTKPAVLPSASGMSATTRSKEKPMPKEKPLELYSSKAEDAAGSETLGGSGAGVAPSKKKRGKRGRRSTCTSTFASGPKQGEPCGAEEKSPCGMFCIMHSRQGSRDRTCGRGGKGGDDEAEYEQEAEGNHDMSDGGSEGEFPGDAADYDQDVFVSGKSPQQVNAMVDKIQEAWGKEALTFIFGLMQNTKQLVQDRNKKKKARSEVKEDAPEGGDTGEEQKGDEALNTADEHSWTTRGVKTDVDWSARYDGGLSGGRDARSGARGGNCDSTWSGAAGNGGEREGMADDDRSRAGAGGGAAGSFEGDGEGSGRDGNGNGANVGSGNDGNGDGGDGFDFDGEGSYRGDGHQYYDCHRKREGEGEDVSFKPSKKTIGALPAFDPDKLGRFSVDELGELAFTFFSIMFPAAVILLLVRKTYEYFNFCRSTKNPKEQEQRHRDKKARKGKSSWPKKGITKRMMQGVIGIILAIGLVQLPAVHDHWSCHSFHDYKLVRACLPRDMSLLIYGRFFHMASSGAPKRLQDGTTEPGWGSLHHIRYELCGWFVYWD
ncbi:unnamed protein product [Ectocarpus sp. CCAP 1310/34]|nr:unnamed protein product [Ectocarpus sp. CCAP 1310/34]